MRKGKVVTTEESLLADKSGKAGFNKKKDRSRFKDCKAAEERKPACLLVSTVSITLSLYVTSVKKNHFDSHYIPSHEEQE